MIDWTYVIEAVLIIIIASIVWAIIQKAMKLMISLVIIAVIAIIISAVLVNQDLKTLEHSTFVLEDKNKTISIIKEGKLIDAIPEGERLLVFKTENFPAIDETNTFDKAIAKELDGTEKENQKYLLENAESRPKTAAYILKPLAAIMLR